MSGGTPSPPAAPASQSDPFDLGNPLRPHYADDWARAFIESVSILNPRHALATDGRRRRIPSVDELLDHIDRDMGQIATRALENGNTLLHRLGSHAWRPANQAGDNFLAAMERLISKISWQLGAVNCSKRSPLHVAIQNNNPWMARALLAANAPIDLRDGGGDTPLHDAAAQGFGELAALLLAHGANPAIRDHEGRAPWQLAASRGHGALAQVLLAPCEKIDLEATGPGSGPEAGGSGRRL